MRIGISTSVIQRGRTGIAQYLFALLRANVPLTREHQFVLFVLEDDLPLFDFVRDSMTLIPVSEKNRPPVRNILWHQTVLPWLARKHHLDVLHVPSYRRLPWFKPCALVGTIHDLAPFHVARKYDWKRMFYGKVVARQLARRQDQLIAVSEKTAEDVRRWFGVEQGRLSVVHNGLEHERFFPAANGRADALKLGLSKPFFLYVARLEHPGKNHVRLINAFNAFKADTGSNWKLVFGGTDWHGAKVIHEAVRLSPFSSDIQLLGFVPDDDLPDLYRTADVFIYPSLFEGFGMPPIEAMACGCPVISSTRGSLGEIVGNAAALIDPEDGPLISQQMTALASDPDLRARYRAAGLERARCFDWNRTAAETLKIYERAVAGVKLAKVNGGLLRFLNLRGSASRHAAALK